MIRRPPRSTRTDTLFPYTTLFRSAELRSARAEVQLIEGARIGDVTVSASPTVAVSLLPRAVLGLKKGRPEIRVHIERSEEHTSELQSLMRISYAVFCLKKKKIQKIHNT